MLMRALDVQETVIGPNHVQTAATIDELAGVYARQKKYKDAERQYQRAIGILERFDPETNLELAATIERYAAMLKAMERYDDAEKTIARAEDIRDTVAKKAERARDTKPQPKFKGIK